MNWPQESMKDEANYCRNVDGSSRPWCFVQGETGPVKEYCSIPLCSDSPCFPNPCKNRGQCIVNDTTYFCTCLDGFSGDTCEIENLTAEAECKRTKTGWEYAGKRNITTSGRTCQTWSSDSPHSHSFNDLPENYCRNPDREPSPWCYTTDPNKRWEFCSISDCVTPPLECLQNSDPKGALYFGTQNVAETGDPCQRWDSQSPHQHRFGWLGDQDNYCRNSDNGRGPWCYTENPDKRWAYCHVPKC